MTSQQMLATVGPTVVAQVGGLPCRRCDKVVAPNGRMLARVLEIYQLVPYIGELAEAAALIRARAGGYRDRRNVARYY